MCLQRPATWCVIVRSGGNLTVRLGSDSLALTLPADRVWLVTVAAQSSSTEASGVWIIEQRSKSHLILDPATGAEVSRRAAEGANDLSALFDAMRTAPPTEPSEEDGS